jgi:proteasome alpha subunit
MVSPYDFNEAVQHRAEYVDERLREGSPVVGLRYQDGLLLLSARRTQRKTFEIYDRLMMSAIGAQADVEAIRIAALDFAHQEGFSRSPDDVTLNRIVGFALSPALKKAFGDSWSSPLVFRGIFAELGKKPEQDRFAMLNYDGEFAYTETYAVAAGTRFAEEMMADHLKDAGAAATLQDAIRTSLDAWSLGHHHAALPATRRDDDEEAAETELDPAAYLKAQLENMTIEAAILDRAASRDAKFRLLSEDELKPLLPA